MTTRTFRLLGLAFALPLVLSACSDHPKVGSVNVEQSSYKGEYALPRQGTTNGDSLTAGLSQDTARHPTGKQLYNNAARSADKNHDGVAD
ncbi:hypothetical protein E4631_09370 [Hymenobacter sp. UV11]|uniref:hypothetical protein n=1 Tax=Hymenobacter sp. UV11 TaxID=1849735 RepID=UPI0010600364|nr:hypothetical protein [Hymenobacter sp. UV11]TDN39733.1 hypothetical protein A8B98_17315 [Hymenobacter sp. UV11]TFZ67150.1 hypothetical protein E4631_09370 [Hymenobacter sp. UV11]